jgi:predicted enzyme related to lactoylglutathione lyase
MPQGNFVWYEHMTTDVAKAKDFYGKVVGWTYEGMPMPGDPSGAQYNIIKAGDVQVAGMMQTPPGMEWPTGWMGHIGVDDVDASAAQCKSLGGAVHREPSDIPGIGRFAVLADPQGAAFMIFKGTNEAPPSHDGSKDGHIGWRELMAGDMPKVWDFYAQMFGWTKGDSHDMGPMGVYQLFLAGGDKPIGGMMTKPAEVPVAHWAYYFNVDNATAAAERVTAAGGQVIMGPHEVPGPMYIVQAIDPNGGHFALLSMKM